MSWRRKRYEQLSADRGFYPQWLPDGKRLLFLDGDKAAVTRLRAQPRRPRAYLVRAHLRSRYLASYVELKAVFPEMTS